jgi:putative ABC transport system ATP-binding protein
MSETSNGNGPVPADTAVVRPYLIEARNLCKTYPDGHVNAVVDVNFGLAEGEHAAIVGPSGSGKSTLLNLLGALDRPDRGDVYFRSQALGTLKSLDDYRVNEVGFVFQSFLLLPTLTALENVQVPMFEGPRRRASERARRAMELLKAVGMLHRAMHRPSQLSVGERQRVAIARALANDPAVLLADEPTGNLDSANAAAILDLFDALNREHGLTLVVVTHSEEVSRRARRVLSVRDGRVVEDSKTPAREQGVTTDPALAIQTR